VKPAPCIVRLTSEGCLAVCHIGSPSEHTSPYDGAM
jgi:hypothetical protein